MAFLLPVNLLIVVPSCVCSSTCVISLLCVFHFTNIRMPSTSLLAGVLDENQGPERVRQSGLQSRRGQTISELKERVRVLEGQVCLGTMANFPSYSQTLSKRST